MTMKASTAGVYGAGIENGKRKIKSENRSSKSERSPNSETESAIGESISGFGFLSAIGFRFSGLFPRHHFLLLGDASDLNIGRADERKFPHLCGRPSRSGGQRHL